ncbi:hypothetical protein A3305_07400 (plasmid) [Rickettsia amblyommatis]|nr:hypothetical protein [Rickettsia amblyommatis]AEC46358.1 hypothetical protein pRAM32_09 [Rickettsia amblyommatis str. AaR/SC]ARD88191.1 hypothetical protein A3305_07400 [Rickettsia amblyommatis]
MQQVASASINSMVKYCTQSKGYIEDASDDFTFAKVLPNHSLVQDKLGFFHQESQNIATPQSIDWVAVRKLIYVRFTDEIVAKPKNVANTKSHDTKECVDAVALNNIADEFKELREQGYNFKKLRDLIANHNLAGSENIEEKSSSDNNSISKSIGDRMKELVISGYMSSYSGEFCLKDKIEEVILKKDAVIKELIHRVQERANITDDNSVLLVDSKNDEAMTDIGKTDLLGEY